MKKQKIWHYSVYKNGKKLFQINANNKEAEYIAEKYALRHNGKIKKGFTLK